MPVKRRLSKKRREPWTEAHRIALGSGQRYLGVFGGHRHPWVMDEAREAWADVGESMVEEWREQHPTLRPWGWWHFDYGMEPPQGKSRQRRYLHEHNLFTASEAAMVEDDPDLLVLKPWHRDW